MVKAHYTAVWISDVHLGSKGCKAKQLLKFLKSISCEKLFLVGDIIDMWAMKRGSKWTSAHNEVAQQILKMSCHGVEVIYIPGNHDATIREYTPTSIGNIKVHHDYNYTTKVGLKMFITHGDEFDVVSQHHKWIAVLGDIGYEFLLSLNTHLNVIRTKLGLRYWSLSTYVKHRVKEAVNFIGDYELNLVKHANYIGVDAILCGHIHHAEIKYIGDIMYLNTGDWVESLTAIVEDLDGNLKLIHTNSITNT